MSDPVKMSREDTEISKIDILSALMELSLVGEHRH